MAAIKAKVGAEITAFERAMQNVEARAKATGASLRQLGDSMSKMVTGPLVAIGAGLFAATVKAANFADEIDKTSIRTGLSATRLQELSFVADQTGVSFGAVEGAVNALRRRLPQLDSPTSRASQALDRIGIAARDSRGNLRDMDDLFPDIIRGLSAVENETERGVLAIELLGRSSANLIPLLAAGEEGIAQLTGRAHELGLVMGDDTIKEMVDFKDQMAEVQQQAGAVGREFGMILLPILRDELIPLVQDRIVPTVRDLAERFNNMDEATKRNVLAFGALVAAMGPMVAVTGRLLTNIVPLVSAMRALTVVMMANPILLVAGAMAGLVAHTYMAARRTRELREELEAVRHIDVGSAGEDELQRLQAALIEVTRQLDEADRNFVGRDARAVEYHEKRKQALEEQRQELIELIQQVGLNTQAERSSQQQQVQTTQAVREAIPYVNEYRTALTELRDVIASDEFQDFDISFGFADIDDIIDRLDSGLGVSLGEIDEVLASLNRQYLEAFSDERREQIQAQIDKFEELRESLEGVEEAASGAGDEMSYQFGVIDGAINTALSRIDVFNASWDNLGRTAERVMRQIINDLVRMAALRAFQALLGISSGGAGFALFGGFRAEGGPVTAGRSYVVGEEGPELFTPGTSGMITPNDALQAGAPRQVSAPAEDQTVSLRLSGSLRADGKDLVYVIDEYNREVDSL